MILARYVFGHCLGGIVVALLALLALFVFIEVIDALEDVGRGSYRTIDALVYALSHAPRLLVALVPVAAIVGTLAGLGGLASRRELAAMQGAGMSLFAVSGAALAAGLAMALTAMLCAEKIAPAVERGAEVRRQAAVAGATALRRHWVRDGDTFASVLAPPGGTGDTLGGVTLYEFNGAGELRSTAHANSARFEARSAGEARAGWRLFDVRQTSLSAMSDGAPRAASSRVDEAAWHSRITPAVVELLAHSPERLSTRDLHRYVDYRERNGLDAQRFRLALTDRIVYPFSTLAMVLLAVPLVLRNQASGRLATRVALGAALGVAFHTLNQMTGLAGIVFGLPVWFAASAMTWLAGLVGLLLMWRHA